MLKYIAIHIIVSFYLCYLLRDNCITKKALLSEDKYLDYIDGIEALFAGCFIPFIAEFVLLAIIFMKIIDLFAIKDSEVQKRRRKLGKDDDLYD